MRLFILIAFLLPFSLEAQENVTAVKGSITDKTTKETMPFVIVLLVDSTGKQAGGTSTDLDGMFVFKNIANGNYTLILSYVGYGRDTVKNIWVKSGNINQVNISMVAASAIIEAPEITTYMVPLIDPENSGPYSVNMTKKQRRKLDRNLKREKRREKRSHRNDYP